MSTSRLRARLILASGSPRRHDLLRAEGFDFIVRRPDVDESARDGESPESLAQRLALDKARAVAASAQSGDCVLAADTLVVVDDVVLGKPAGASEAAAMLLRIAGRAHRVLTGYAALQVGDGASEVGVEESRVEMHSVTPEEARAYAASGEPLDKAGAYAVQGEGGRFVARIEGSRSNVIGLPLEAVVPLLARFGVAPA